MNFEVLNLMIFVRRFWFCFILVLCYWHNDLDNSFMADCIQSQNWDVMANTSFRHWDNCTKYTYTVYIYIKNYTNTLNKTPGTASGVAWINTSVSHLMLIWPTQISTHTFNNRVSSKFKGQRWEKAHVCISAAVLFSSTPRYKCHRLSVSNL